MENFEYRGHACTHDHKGYNCPSLSLFRYESEAALLKAIDKRRYNRDVSYDLSQRLFHALVAQHAS